jgi:hypothetical protein
LNKILYNNILYIMSNSIGIAFSPGGGSGYTTGSLGDLAGIIKGIGSNIPIIVKGKAVGVSLGGGFKGYMPQSDITNYHSNEFSQIRFTLREAWNTTKYSGQNGLGNTRIITPFRAVNNAGDVLSRQNYSCGGNCQTFQSRPNLKGLRQRFGAIQNICDETSIPPAACNVKYVYDASDYTTFLKQQAVNRNYNDRSFGGDDYSSSQSAQRAVKRY